MRVDRRVLVSLIANGCAFGQEPGPTTQAGIVSNLLVDRLVEGAVVLLPPADDELANAAVLNGLGPVVAEGGGLIAAQASDEGELSMALGGPGSEGTLASALLERGLVGSAYSQVRVTAIGEASVAWICENGQESSILVVLDEGSAEPREVATPGACPEAIAEGPGGSLLTGTWTPSGFDVRRYTIGAAELSEEVAIELPSELADRVLRVGDDGEGPWVLGATGSALVWSGPDGTATLSLGYPRTLDRDGGDVLLTANTPDTLYRWTPSTGQSTEVGRITVAATEWAFAGQDGAIGLLSEPWPTGTAATSTTPTTDVYVREAWWVPPAVPFVAVPMPTSPCLDEAAGLDVGEWRPAGVLEGSDARWGVWTVWSWLGPSAVVAAPF